MSDLKYALRQLLKHPGFTAVAVSTLALCIGSNLAIFAVVDGILLRPLPFPESDRLVTMFNTYPKAQVLRDGSTVANYFERRGGKISAFSSLALFRFGTAVVGDPGASERKDVIRISPEYFQTLGIGPALGRGFTDEEMSYQTDGVAILTDSYWRRHFDADPEILGRTVRVDGDSRIIVGVLPRGFRFLSSRAQVYLPLSSNAEQRLSSSRHSGSGAEIVARLESGVTLAVAQAQIDALDTEIEGTLGAKSLSETGYRSVVVPLRADHVHSIRPMLLLVQAGAICLLLIGGVNLINLLLIRANGRTKELAIRQSLGAGRWDVIRQVAVEALLLAAVGSLAGLAVGAGGVKLFAVLGADRLPLGTEIAVSGRLVWLAMIGSLGLGIPIAIPLVWFALRTRLALALQSQTRGATVGLVAQRLRHGFVVSQIALAFMLLSSAGLLGLSLQNLTKVSPGFQPDHVLAGQISLPWKNYPDRQARFAFSERLLGKVRALPGVRQAGIGNNVPFSGNVQKNAAHAKGHVLRPGESPQGSYRYAVSGDYFTAMGIPLLEGRFLDSADNRTTPRVCVVDEDFARRYWPKGGAIGGQLFQGLVDGEDEEAFTIVGVVGSVKQAGLAMNEAQGAVYYPYLHGTDDGTFLAIRTVGDPQALAVSLNRIVRELDPDLALSDLGSMDARIAESLMTRRSPAMLIGAFSGVAMLLAALGIYGVLAHAVSQCRREIGIRMAVGAEPKQVAAQVLGAGSRLFLIGSALGVIGAWAAGRGMQNLLFQVPSLHWETLLGTGLILGIVASLACWLPARRAAGVDPMVALRTE
ncbi:MAG TPA: hypothetical protein DCY13_07840 [Verrucomicrobiales bacterium]|nr:hypothetical protein [Verrucomicrobiales bacterium]